MSKMKLLLLGKLPPPYIGPAIATEILLNSKLKEIYTLYHLDTNVHHDLSTLRIWKLKKIKKNLRIYFRFLVLIITHRPDIVLIPISQRTIGFLKDSIFIIISRLFFRKTLLQLRGSNIKNWLAKSSAVTRCYVAALLKSAQGIIVLGERLKPLFAEYFSDDKIFVVPNGANLKFKISNRKNTIPKILYFSNLLSSKGIEDVLEAIIILKKYYRLNFFVDAVGDWNDEFTKQNCIKARERQNLPLSFHSPVIGKEKAAYFENADIFVFPPREPEGHPWVIVESMAAGLPIITTNQGAIAESVIDGVNGFIVDGSSPEQIAEKIKYLIDNSEVREKMGQESRRLYEKYFTEEMMVYWMSKAIDFVLDY